MKTAKFFPPIFFVFFLIGAFFFSPLSPSDPTTSVSAQGNLTATPVVPTIDPTTAALENVIATQQILLEDQNRKINNMTDDLSRAETDWQWKWGILGIIVGAVGTILASLGFSSLTDYKKKLTEIDNKFTEQLNLLSTKWDQHAASLEKSWETRSSEKLNLLLERFDLKNLPIYIPKGNGNLLRRLELSGLQHAEYENLTTLSSMLGVIVVKFENKDEQKTFREFIERSGLNPQKTAFVLYAEPSSVEKDTIKCFENIVVANFPATVVSNILAIGRGLQIES